MQIRVLGHVEASLDDRPLALGAAKQRAVLAMLGLKAGHAVSADRQLDVDRDQVDACRLERLVADAARGNGNGNAGRAPPPARGDPAPGSLGRSPSSARHTGSSWSTPTR